MFDLLCVGAGPILGPASFFFRLARTSIFSLGAIVVLAQVGLAQSVPQAALATPPVIVIGFVGGFIKHDNLVHGKVHLAPRVWEQVESLIGSTYPNKRGLEL